MLLPIFLGRDSSTCLEVPGERRGVIEAQPLADFLDGKVGTVMQQRFGLDDDIVGDALTGVDAHLFFDEAAEIFGR